MSYFVVITVLTDCLTPLGAGKSAGILMTRFRSHVYTAPAVEGLSFENRIKVATDGWGSMNILLNNNAIFSFYLSNTYSVLKCKIVTRFRLKIIFYFQQMYFST